VISATQAAAGSYAAATQNASFTVAVEVPALAFAPVAAQNTDSIPFTVSASSPSAGALTYLVVSGPATIAGSTLTQTGAGTVVLSVSQAAAGSLRQGAHPLLILIQPSRPQPPRRRIATIRSRIYPQSPWRSACSCPSLGLKRARRQLRRIGRSWRSSIAALVLFGALAALAGCGSTGPSYPAPQAYVVAVTVTDAATGAHTAIDLALTVQ
jgi:predicted small lipoprotein YifL